MQYVGLDVHKHKVYGVIMTEQGKILKEGTFPNKKENYLAFLKGTGEASIALEALAFSHPPYDLLEQQGYTVKLAHPLKTRAIAEAKIKTDKIDAHILAHLLRSDFLPTSYLPPPDIRDLRDMVRQRAYLVKLRTELKNKIHAELHKHWIEAPYKNIFTQQGKHWLHTLHLPNIHRYLSLLEHLEEQIKDISSQITTISQGNRDAQLLMTIPGIGPYSALLLIAEIGDITRFRDSHKLCSYAGLAPSTRQSGHMVHHGHITKTGNKWLRWVLTQSVHIHLKYDTHLTHFYHTVAHRRGKKIAIVATASKLLRVIYWMLKNQEKFHPSGLSRTGSSSFYL
jgi:transposase